MTEIVRAVIAMTLALFPVLPARNLNERSLIVPHDLPNKACVFVVTFSREASREAARWSSALRREIQPSEAVVFDVAVLEDVPRFVRSFVVRQIRGSVPDSSKDTFLVATDHEREWKELVGFAEGNDAHVVAINGRRQTVWRAHGKFEANKLITLLSAVRKQNR